MTCVVLKMHVQWALAPIAKSKKNESVERFMLGERSRLTTADHRRQTHGGIYTVLALPRHCPREEQMHNWPKWPPQRPSAKNNIEPLVFLPSPW